VQIKEMYELHSPRLLSVFIHTHTHTHNHSYQTVNVLSHAVYISQLDTDKTTVFQDVTQGGFVHK